MVDLRKQKEKPIFLNKPAKKEKIPKLKRIVKKKMWNEELARQEALKYKKRSEWNGKSPSSYSFAFKNGLLKKLTKHMGKPLTGESWTKEKCIKFSKNFKFIKDWRQKHSKSYRAAIKYSWFKECSINMNRSRNPVGFWENKNNIINEMNKYSTRREFHRENGTAYLVAKQNFNNLLNKKFPLVESSTTSLGEKATKTFLQKIFKSKFIKKSHDFLINPKTGRKLELDGYCDSLKIAFEYGNHQSLAKRIGNKEYNRLKNRDKFKKDKCKELGIKLLQLNIDSLKYRNPKEHLKQQIRKELIFHKIVIPKDFDKTKIKIVQFKNKKWNKEKVWKAVFKSKNVNNLKKRFGGAYGTACRLGFIEEIRSYFNKKNHNWSATKAKIVALR